MHDRCLKTVVSPCSSISASLIKVSLMVIFSVICWKMCHHILYLAPDHLLAMNFHGSSWGYHATSVVHNFFLRAVVQRRVSVFLVPYVYWITNRGSIFSLLWRVHTGFRTHSTSYSEALGGFFPGGKAVRAWSWPFYLHLVLMWRNGGAKPSVPYMSSLLALGQLYFAF